MERSKGSKKVLQTVTLVVALAAALATTGCTGSSLMGPETTQSDGQVASGAGNTMNPAGNGMKP